MRTVLISITVVLAAAGSPWDPSADASAQKILAGMSQQVRRAERRGPT